MLSRILFIVGGVMLLLVGGAGLVLWVTGFTFLKEALLDGVPFLFDTSSRQVQIPGRAIGAAALVVPVLGAVGGTWLLRAAFERDNGRSN